MLNNLDTLIEEAKEFILDPGPGVHTRSFVADALMYCPTCVKERKMRVSLLQVSGIVRGLALLANGKSPDRFSNTKEPGLFQYGCEECCTRFAVLIYSVDNTPVLALFPNKLGGLSTPSTPPEVAYFLNQAYLSRCASSVPATLVMYRAVIEQVLDDKDYSTSAEVTLFDRLVQLEEEVRNKSAPLWAKRINLTALQILRRLANELIHPEYIENVQAMDFSFVDAVEQALTHLLRVVYEEPAKLKAQRQVLADIEYKLAQEDIEREAE